MKKKLKKYLNEEKQQEELIFKQYLNEEREKGLMYINVNIKKFGDIFKELNEMNNAIKNNKIEKITDL